MPTQGRVEREVFAEVFAGLDMGSIRKIDPALVVHHILDRKTCPPDVPAQLWAWGRTLDEIKQRTPSTGNDKHLEAEHVEPFREEVRRVYRSIRSLYERCAQDRPARRSSSDDGGATAMQAWFLEFMEGWSRIKECNGTSLVTARVGRRERTFQKCEGVTRSDLLRMYTDPEYCRELDTDVPKCQEMQSTLRHHVAREMPTLVGTMRRNSTAPTDAAVMTAFLEEHKDAAREWLSET